MSDNRLKPSCSNRRLKNELTDLQLELKEVFGEDVDVDVEDTSIVDCGDQTLYIALLVILVACTMLLIVAMVLLIW